LISLTEDNLRMAIELLVKSKQAYAAVQGAVRYTSQKDDHIAWLYTAFRRTMKRTFENTSNEAKQMAGYLTDHPGMGKQVAYGALVAGAAGILTPFVAAWFGFHVFAEGKHEIIDRYEKINKEEQKNDSRN